MDLSGYARLIESMIPANSRCVIDESRTVYRPLMIYSRLLAMKASGQLDNGIRDSIATLDDSIWSALVFRVAGELLGNPHWIEKSRIAFELLVTRQQPSGEFLPPNRSANLESRGYDELTLLHAAASYAVRVPGPAIKSAVLRSAQFHLQETQPDHATAEPWGLLAFMQYAPPLADQVLHAMSMQYPQGVTGAALLLLVDVRYGLRRLMREDL